jgi:hypothetical protein
MAYANAEKGSASSHPLKQFSYSLILVQSETIGNKAVVSQVIPDSDPKQMGPF